MHLAAMIDLGVPKQYLTDELAKLNLTSEFKLTFESGSKMGVSGTRAEVHAADQQDHRHHDTIVEMITNAGFSQAIEDRALRIFKILSLIHI